MTGLICETPPNGHWCEMAMDPETVICTLGEPLGSANSRGRYAGRVARHRVRTRGASEPGAEFCASPGTRGQDRSLGRAGCWRSTAGCSRWKGSLSRTAPVGSCGRIQGRGGAKRTCCPAPPHLDSRFRGNDGGGGGNDGGGESALVFGPIYYGTDGGSMSARLPVGKLEAGGGEMEDRSRSGDTGLSGGLFDVARAHQVERRQRALSSPRSDPRRDPRPGNTLCRTHAPR